MFARRFKKDIRPSASVAARQSCSAVSLAVAVVLAAALGAADAWAYACPPGFKHQVRAERLAGRQILSRGQTVTLWFVATLDCKHSAVVGAEKLSRLQATFAESAAGPFAPLPVRIQGQQVSLSLSRAGAHFVRFQLPDPSLPAVEWVFFVTDAKLPAARPLRVTLVTEPDKPGQPPSSVGSAKLLLRLLPPTGLPPDQRDRWLLPSLPVVMRGGRSAPLLLPPGLYEVGEGEEWTEASDYPPAPKVTRTIFRSLLGVLSIEKPGPARLPFVR